MPADPDRAHNQPPATGEPAPDGRETSLTGVRGDGTSPRDAAEGGPSPQDTSGARTGSLSQLATDAGFLTEPPTSPTAPDLPDRALGPGPGTVLAERYTLTERIGEGGMGSVWAARQSEPVKRSVAVKLVKAGMDSRSVLARFEQERQALALMDHPSIAKVFDAGMTPTGQPFFVMELVDGQPLTWFCDDERLTPRQRLELFVPICQAVQHAHQKGIVHRDLKPGNILVTRVDGKPTPKVIDFGLVKATEGSLTEMSMATQLGAVIGTLEYMAPEQAAFVGTDIDTRADIYSLGVILYELLTGQRPVDSRRLKQATFTEMVRIIQEEDPDKPSRRLASEATLTELAAARHTEPGKLLSQLRGDLDWVVMKCLEKQRERRYASANGLARDIERYLSDEVVEARPPSTGYRMGKFLRRNRGSALAAAAVTAALIVGVVAFARQARVAGQQRDLARAAGQAEARQRLLANQERDRAVAAEVQAQRDRSRAQGSEAQALEDRNLALEQKRRADSESAAAKAVNDFLQNDLLAQASASNQSGETARPDPDLKVRTALDRAAARVAGKFDRQPELEAAIRNTIGRTYLDLGQYPEAAKQLESAVELYRRKLGANHPRTLSATNQLGDVYRLQGKYAEAEALYLETLEIQKRVLGPEHPSTVSSSNGLAYLYLCKGEYPQAETLWRQALEVSGRVLGSEHPNTLSILNNVAEVCDRQGKYAQAEALNTQALEIRRRTLGPEHPDTLSSMNNLAKVRAMQGKYAEAEALHGQALEISRRVLGPEHPDTLNGMYWMATSTARQGRSDEAEALYRQVLEVRRRTLGPEHPDTLSALAGLASMCQAQGKYSQAETHAAQTLAGRRKALGPDHAETVDGTVSLAVTLQAQEKFAQSETLARQAVELDRQKRPDDWRRFHAESVLGGSLAGQKKYAEAEPLLIGGCQGMAARRERMAVPDLDHLDRALDRVVRLYEAWGKPELAAEWRTRAKTLKAAPASP